MKNKYRSYVYSIEYLVIGFAFIILFLLPVLFTRVNGEISWNYVLKIWKDQALLIPLFAFNHWFFVPKILFRKQYLFYLSCVFGLIALFTTIYYFHDEVRNKKLPIENDVKVRMDRVEDNFIENRDVLQRNRISDKDGPDENEKPESIPPYAHLLMYSLLIVGVDTGLSFSKKWHENEEKKQLLENENTKMQLDILRNQISPHFFMNTMNNIYGLIDLNSQAAKDSVMKLSKLMRYMLYDNANGKVKLSREFEFIKSYIDLMRLRSDENLNVQLVMPENYDDIDIPSMLFISYIENAFKYGISYQTVSFINVVFEIYDKVLHFTCINTKNTDYEKKEAGGLGLKNNENRLKLLFGSNYSLVVKSSEKLFNVSLAIPIS